jgi:hypothetical protein
VGLQPGPRHFREPRLRRVRYRGRSWFAAAVTSVAWVSRPIYDSGSWICGADCMC